MRSYIVLILCVLVICFAFSQNQNSEEVCNGESKKVIGYVVPSAIDTPNFTQVLINDDYKKAGEVFIKKQRKICTEEQIRKGATEWFREKMGLSSSPCTILFEFNDNAFKSYDEYKGIIEYIEKTYKLELEPEDRRNNDFKDSYDALTKDEEALKKRWPKSYMVNNKKICIPIMALGGIVCPRSRIHTFKIRSCIDECKKWDLKIVKERL